MARTRCSRSPESVFTMARIGVHDDRNRCSASAEPAFTLKRNERSRWTGIRTSVRCRNTVASRRGRTPGRSGVVLIQHPSSSTLREMSGAITVVWLSDEAAKKLMAEASTKSPLETGGVLLGYQVADGRETVITAVAGPGPKAQHSSTAYLPDHEYQEREIGRVYAASGRCTTYVGDWHSHPGGSLYLSRTDVGTLRAIARHEPARVPHPVMIVAASGTHKWQIGAWQWRPKWLNLTAGAARAALERF